MDKFKLNKNIESAARLLYLGIKGKINSQNEKEFNELIKNYKSDSQLRDVLEKIADGMRLDILDIDETGIYLRPREGSIFCLKKKDINDIYYQEENKYFALILVALAAFLFPRAETFERDHYESLDFTLQELVNYIESQCKLITEDIDSEDPELNKEDLVILAKSFLDLKNESHHGSRERNTKQYFVKKTLKFLKKQDYLEKSKERYYTNVRLRVEIESLSEDEFIEQLIDEFEGLNHAKN